ncbi:MAG TPA: hypothetical protein VGB88_02285 [Alphaproteobacteria bacterium]
MVQNSTHGTLEVISFGLAGGVCAALITLVLGFSAMVFGWGVAAVQVLSSLLVGFGPSFVGLAAGVVWAFFDGFVASLLLAWLYNRFVLRRRRHII